MSTINAASPDKVTIRSIFDEIAFRYDFLNAVLSFRMDDGWRKNACRLILEGREESLLDLGVGTGKFLEHFLKAKTWKRVAGLDFAHEMLARARKNMPAGPGWVSGDFHDLPFANASFDLIVSAYTLRSVKNLPLFFRENYRVLAPGGKLALLCLTRPKTRAARLLYYPYLNLYIPLVGRLVSGSSRAYSFLSQSIQKFQDPESTVQIMREAGFGELKQHSFTLGAATLIVGRKAA